MSNATAVLEVENAHEEPVSQDIEITVNVDFGRNMSLSKPYVSVPQGEVRHITWTLISELPDVFFDSPALTMFGQSPEFEFVQQSATVQKVRWSNLDPQNHKRSFHYRLHLVQKIGDMYVPINVDPIVRNDPPPAP